MDCLPFEITREFGLALKHWRTKAGMTQEELAWRAGLHRTYVSGVERGVRNVSLQTISKLAHALDLSLSELFQPIDQLEKAPEQSR